MKRAGRSLVAAALLPFFAGCSGGTVQPSEMFGGDGSAPTAKSGATAKPSPTKAKTSDGAPQVTAVTFRPPQGDNFPTVNDKITAAATTTDPDGDGVSVEWKWFINGVEVTGALADSLPPGRWKKNDKIEAEATPRDVKGTVGSPLRGFILIRNSTPAITSRPAGSLNGYKAVVADADIGDPTERFKWSLEAPVPGFTLGDDGTLRFDAVAGKGSSGQKVTIVVTDSAGALSKQTFDVKF